MTGAPTPHQKSLYWFFYRWFLGGGGLRPILQIIENILISIVCFLGGGMDITSIELLLSRERVCAWHLLSQLQRAHPCLDPKTWACIVGRLDAYCRVAAALVQLEIHLGVRVGVDTCECRCLRAACVSSVSRYNERLCITRLGRGVILCLPCVCSANNCHRDWAEA